MRSVPSPVSTGKKRGFSAGLDYRGRRAPPKIDIVNPEKAIAVEGTIMSVLPGTMFRVALANEHLVLAHISGKMRKRFIRLTIGDRVKMEMSPYDTDKARIVYRL